MIQINLLPARTKKKKAVGSRVFVYAYLIGTLCLIAAIGYVWLSQENELASLKNRLTQVQQEVGKYAKYENLVKELTKRKDLLDKKKKVINDLQKDRDTLVRLLALVSVSLPPEKVWLDRFSQSANGITLNGVAMSNEAVAEFLRNLESSPYIQKGTVNLIHSRQMVSGAMKLREFQVTCRFYPFSEVQKILEAKSS